MTPKQIRKDIVSRLTGNIDATVLDHPIVPIKPVTGQSYVGVMVGNRTGESQTHLSGQYMVSSTAQIDMITDNMDTLDDLIESILNLLVGNQDFINQFNHAPDGFSVDVATHADTEIVLFNATLNIDTTSWVDYSN